MLKKSISIIAIAAAYFVNAQDVSTIRNSIDVYSNSQNIGSAKYNSMVGATGALGGDATSLLNNPAGLGVAITGNVSGTLGLNNYSNKSQLGSNSYDFNRSTFDLNNLNGIATFQLLTETKWKFMNLGVNLSNRNLDSYIESPANNHIILNSNSLNSNNLLVSTPVSLDGHAYNRIGNQSRLDLGIGANYDNRLYFGAGIGLHSANIDQLDTAAFNESGNRYEYTKQYTPFNELSSGFSMNLGVIAKISNQLRLGAAIESPTWWQIERIYTDLYTDNTYNEFTEDRSFSSPMRSTLSAALVPNKNFSINIDYVVGLTKPRYRVFGDAERELNDYFSENTQNSSEIRVGAEYRIKAMRFRGGYSQANSPFDSVHIPSYNNSNGVVSNNTFSNLIVGKRTTYGLGFGYDFKKFNIDLAYQNHKMEFHNPFLFGSVFSEVPRYTTGYISGYKDVTEQVSAVSTVNNQQNLFTLSFVWKF